jgi:hypothetical protein
VASIARTMLDLGRVIIVTPAIEHGRYQVIGAEMNLSPCVHVWRWSLVFGIHEVPARTLSDGAARRHS